MYYNQGVEVAYEGYDVDIESKHAFVTFITIKSKRFQWRGDLCDILGIPTGEVGATGNPVTKFLLKHDGEFTLPKIKTESPTGRAWCRLPFSS